MKDGTVIAERMKNANAHPNGASPFARADYMKKFTTLTEEILERHEVDRFLRLAQDLPHLDAEQVQKLLPVLPKGRLIGDKRNAEGIF